MTKIYCGACDCKYNGDKGRCTAKKISLADSYYNTVYEGYKHFNICKTYEKSDWAKRVDEMMEKVMLSDKC